MTADRSIPGPSMMVAFFVFAFDARAEVGALLSAHPELMLLTSMEQRQALPCATAKSRWFAGATPTATSMQAQAEVAGHAGVQQEGLEVVAVARAGRVVAAEQVLDEAVAEGAEQVDARDLAEHRFEALLEGRGVRRVEDLVHFKNVNDSLGHPAGDELLRIAADRMKHRIRACGRAGPAPARARVRSTKSEALSNPMDQGCPSGLGSRLAPPLGAEPA